MPKVITDDGLTDRQRAFVRFYVETLNATQAAKRAGYSERTAYASGAENLKKPVVRAAIDSALAESAMSANEVLERLNQQARAEQSAFQEDDLHGGVFVNLRKLQEAGLGHLIKTVKRDGKTNRITEVQFYDAQAALELLGRHRKLFTDRVEHSGKVSVDVSDLSDDELGSIARSGNAPGGGARAAKAS